MELEKIQKFQLEKVLKSKRQLFNNILGKKLNKMVFDKEDMCMYDVFKKEYIFLMKSLKRCGSRK